MQKAVIKQVKKEHKKQVGTAGGAHKKGQQIFKKYPVNFVFLSLPLSHSN